MPILYNINIDDYHANPAVSHSKLEAFRRKGAWYYWARFIDKSVAGPDSASLLLGRAFDTLVFEGPSGFDAQYIVTPANHDGRTKDGKAYKAQAEASGKAIIKHDDYKRFDRMLDNITQNTAAMALLAQGKAQVTLRCSPKMLPFEAQSRPDWLHIDDAGSYGLDLKTVDDLDRFPKSVVDFGAYRQAALCDLICDANDIQLTKHWLLAVERSEPHRVKVFELSPNYIHIGFDEVTKELERLADHYDSDTWPLVDVESEVLEPPNWLAIRAEERRAAA